MSLRRFALILLGTLTLGPAVAQTVRWDGQTLYPGQNDVTNPLNWQNDVPPNPGDNLVFGLLPTGPNNNDFDYPYQIVYVPASVPLSVGNINFDGTSITHPAYRFSGGTGNSITVSGNITVLSNNAATFDSSLNLILTPGVHNATSNTPPTGLVVQSNISGAGASLVVNGSGHIALSGQSTFDGGVTLAGGVLHLGSSTTPSGPSFTSGPLGTGTFTISDGELINDGNITINNLVNLTGNVSFNGNSDIDIYTLTLNGAMAGIGKISLYNDNHYAFNGDNHAWSGGLLISTGTSGYHIPVYATTDTALGTGGVEFSNGSTANLDLSSSAPVIHGLSGGFYNDSEYSSQVSIGASTALTITQNTDTTFAGQFIGDGSLTKTGTGTLTLTGPALHTGTTAVNGGRILLYGSDARIESSAVTVNNGGTLGLHNNAYATNVTVNSGGKLIGDSFVQNALINTGGTLSPGLSGAAIGILSFEHLELGKGSIVQLDFKGPASFDQVFVSESLDTLVIQATSNPGEQVLLKLQTLTGSEVPGMATGFDLMHGAYTWTIFDASQSHIAGYTGANQFLIDGSQFTTDIGSGSFSLSQAGETLQLTFTPVPEPSTWALLITGLGIVFLGMRRKRKHRG